MENATKALLITAGVLIGVLTLSLGIYLYSVLGQYITNTQNDMENNATKKFNNQFLKYVDAEQITIQDIATVANLAHQNNEKHGLTSNDVDNANVARENFYYVRVTIIGDEETNIEDYDNNLIAILLGDDLVGTKSYECTSSDISISSVTGRVYQITFREK